MYHLVHQDIPARHLVCPLTTQVSSDTALVRQVCPKAIPIQHFIASRHRVSYRSAQGLASHSQDSGS